MKTWIQHIMFLSNDKQKTVTDGIHICANTAFLVFSKNVFMCRCCFIHLKNSSICHPSLYNLTTVECLNLEVIGEKTVNCICAEVFRHNKSNRIGMLLGGEWPSQFDCFIREKSGKLVYLSTIKNLVKHIFFCSYYKKSIIKMKMREQKVKLNISFGHKIVRVGFYRYLILNFGIVNCPFCQMNKCWDDP